MAHTAFATDFNASTSADFQAALVSAVPGDNIILTAGQTFTGNFTLPLKTGTGWITIRSSALASLPPAGVRVNPSYAQYMPKIVSPNDQPGLQAASGAHHYRVIGVEFKPTAGIYTWGIIALSLGSETDVNTLSHDLEFDRVYVHGDPTAGAKNGILLNSASTTVKNSYIADIKSSTQEAHGMIGWNGPGPFHIVNNYVEASSENIMFGGALAAIANMVPSDIEIRQNYLSKPLAWKGSQWWVKNLLEFKNARRVVVDGNMIENSWRNQQDGAAVLFTVRTESGAMPWAVVEDVTFTHNWVRHAGSGFVISGEDDSPIGMGKGRRIKIENNVFEDVNATTWGAGGGALLRLVHRTEDIIFNHNTAIQTGPMILMDGVTPELRTVFENNIVMQSGGFVGSGAGSGTSAINDFIVNPTMTNNLIIGGPAASYPPNNMFPPQVADVGFVNATASDYHLASSSAYKGTAADAKDPGADIDSLNAAIAGVTTSSTATNPVGAVAVLPVAAAVLSSQTQQFSAVVDGSTTNAAITWSLSSPSAGSISSSGVYSAPQVTSAQTVSVIATSAADQTKKGSAQVTILPPRPVGNAVVRVNAGGGTYTDPQGNIWSADTGYLPSVANVNSTTAVIAGTTTAPLYQTERVAGWDLGYQFYVPNGTYNVTLKFAEIDFTAAGLRTFNVLINGQNVESNFDIFAAAGGSFKAIDKTYPVTVTDGQISIVLMATKDKAKISAIQILPATGTPTPTPTPSTTIRVNAGGPAYAGSGSTAWSADTGFAGGSTYSTTAAVTGTTDPALYQTERWSSSTLQYQFPVANGAYAVNLKFAEIYFTAAGQRVFNIVINGRTVQSNFDPFAAAGGAFKAIDKSYAVNVTAGQIVIQLVPVISNPKISAIEIVASTSAPSPAAVRVNSGGAAYKDASANTWSADSGFLNGSTYSTSSTVTGTTDPLLYQTERWASGTLQYQFTVANGTHTVNLKFAEIYFNSAGQRVFNIVINGQTVQSSFDPFVAAGGAFKAVDKGYSINVTGGQITVQLVPLISNPKISAIEIL